MTFLLTFNFFANDCNKKYQEIKENLITHAINNLKNNCALELV